MEDRKIVDRILSHGDVDCFRHIVSRYTPVVLSKTLGILKDRDLATEVTQQTFIRAYDRLSTWQGTQLGPWLTAIACRLSINYLDEARRRRIRHKESAEYNDNEYDEEHELLLSRMEKAIDELPDSDRSLIQMHYYEKMKTDEIAHETGLSQSNVLVKLHRIRERLKTSLLTSQS